MLRNAPVRKDQPNFNIAQFTDFRYYRVMVMHPTTRRALYRLFTVPALAVLLFLGIALRLKPVLEFPDTRRGGQGPYADPMLYHALALNLIEGRGYVQPPALAEPHEPQPVIFRAPGYPLFLASIYAALGARSTTGSAGWQRTYTAVRVIQSLMDASLCLAVYLILASLFPCLPWVGLMAALLQALNPYGAFWARTLLTESLSGFLLCWAVAVLCLAMHKRRVWLFPVSGLLGGALVLTRPEYLPWVVLAAFICFLTAGKGQAYRIAGPLVFTVCAAVAVAPWTLRNQLVFGRFIPVASGSVGEILHRGTFEGSYAWHGWSWCPPGEGKDLPALYKRYIAGQLSGGAEVFAVDESFFAKALAKIRANPGACLRAWFANIPRLWYQKYIRMFSDPEPPGVYILAALILAGAGALLGNFRRPLFLLVLSAPLYLTLLYLPLHIEARYCVPALPLVAALAAAAAAQAYTVIRNLINRIFKKDKEYEAR